MATLLQPEDLTAFANIAPDKAQAMIEDVEAVAVLAAPCLADAEFREDEAYKGAAKAILRQAVLRRNEAGTGAVSQAGAGPFQQTVDNRNPIRGLLWPSEIAQLRDLCAQYRGESQDQAFTVSMIPESDTDPLASRPDLWLQWVHPTPPDAP